MRLVLLFIFLSFVSWLLIPQAPVTANFSRKSYQKIITLAPSYCETMHALGQSHKLVGITKHCTIPNAHEISKIGSFQDANLEAIVSLDPDLILAVPHIMAQNTLKRLKELGFTVFAHQPDSLQDIYFITREVARMLKISHKGEIIIKKIQHAIKSSKQKFSNTSKTILISVSSTPFVVAGQNTFSAQILTKLGFTNQAIKSSTSWPLWPLEKLISNPPKILLICNGTENFPAYQELFSNLGLFKLKNSPQIILPKQTLFTSPSPKIIQDIQIFSDHVLNKIKL